ncbi:MAG: hypothetical protein JOZ69_14865 [Myxococcales bacterium]|nr:hypothetical protein [Myxococcales bacterium]
MTSLRVVVDGETLPDPEARAFWKRFSEWMDGHHGDLAGFAQAEGFASVHPEMAASGPVLVASRSDPQRPYATAVGPKPSPARSPKVGRAPTGASRRPLTGKAKKGKS